MSPEFLERVQTDFMEALRGGKDCAGLKGPVDAPGWGLDIYRRSYWARLESVLASQFPAVAEALDERFGEQVKAFVRAHPPSSFTLARLGDRFPAWLEEAESPGLGALARLEFDVAEVETRDWPPPLEPEALARLRPEDLGQMRVRFRAAPRSFAYRVFDTYQGYLEDLPSSVPPEGPEDIWISASGELVRLETKDEVLLQVELTSGSTLTEALAALSEPAAGGRILFDWARAGLISSID